MIVFILFTGLIGYLLGALPFGYLVARSKGVNIFEVGSKSPGATNVRRVLGKGPGNLVFALDAFKGAVASSWALLQYAQVSVTYDLSDWGLNMRGDIIGVTWVPLGIAGLIGAMLGHSFSCFTKFRGGKGVATGAGGFFMVMPLSALIAAIVWVAVFLISRYVSLASMVSAVTLPLSAWLFGRPLSAIIIAAIIAVFVVFRHRENCRRLLNGTENRFVKQKPNGPVA
jgi:acyl phosphate:glycerol-3-phosphate acyltransferase